MDQDYAFVDPERLEEIQRRLSAVRAYMERPGRPYAAELAATLGLRTAQFYNLVRAWKETGRPDALARSSRWKERKVSFFEDRDLAKLRELDTQNPDISVNRVVHIALTLSGPERIGIRSAVSLHRMVSKLRRERLAAVPAGNGIAVEFCALDLAVHDAHLPATLAVAALVLDLESRRLVGLALDARGPGPRAAARALRHAASMAIGDGNNGRMDLRITSGIMPNWAALHSSLDLPFLNLEVVSKSKLGGSVAKSILGPSILGVKLKPNATSRPPETRIPAPTDPRRARFEEGAVDVRLAEKVMRYRMAANVQPSPLSRLSLPDRDRLASALDDVG